MLSITQSPICPFFWIARHTNYRDVPLRLMLVDDFGNLVFTDIEQLRFSLH